MKTAYFFVLFLTVTVPDHTDSWFFHSVRRIRFGAYHTLGCKAACNWAQSWACKVCKRFSEFDTSGEADPLEVQLVINVRDGDTGLGGGGGGGGGASFLFGQTLMWCLIAAISGVSL